MTKISSEACAAQMEVQYVLSLIPHLFKFQGTRLSKVTSTTANWQLAIKREVNSRNYSKSVLNLCICRLQKVPVLII